MPNLFPGIDPYLEDSGFWPDFHSSALIYCRDALNSLLPDNYISQVEEQFTLREVLHERGRQFQPDVSLLKAPSASRGPAGAAGVATIEPVIVPLPQLWVEERETWIEIRQLPDYNLVTAIELLSPTNKVEPTHSAYLLKRNGLFQQRVNLMEIDLLVRGRRLPMGQKLPFGDSYVFLTRGERFPNCDVYAWSIRRPLPTLPIPLKAPDPDIPLDLAAVIGRAYEMGRYARLINYEKPLTLPLQPEDRAWAEELARTARG